MYIPYLSSEYTEQDAEWERGFQDGAEARLAGKPLAQASGNGPYFDGFRDGWQVEDYSLRTGD